MRVVWISSDKKTRIKIEDNDSGRIVWVNEEQPDGTWGWVPATMQLESEW